MNLLFEDGGRSDVVPISFVEIDAELASVERCSEAQAERTPVEDTCTKADTDAACDALREELQEQFERRLHDGLETERSAVAHVCGSFLRAREKYFHEVESEVVRLALAVATRVLQREVAMDPLLLAGVVRVALGKLNDVAGTVLHVPETDVELWRSAARLPAALRLEADAGMAAGDCRLEAPVGVAELGVKAQLVEIERGFFDLLARRPA